MEKDDVIIIKDGDVDKEFRILFTIHHDRTNKDYVYIYEDSDPETVLFYEYDENNLIEVEDEELLKEAQEILDSYDEELAKVA